MIYPQSNPHRSRKDLSGTWDFLPDFKNEGLPKGWAKRLRHPRRILVPASWNERFKDLANYLGPCWYQTRFTAPATTNGRRVFLRFGSVNYLAQVWLNGVKLGTHEGGHLPFIFEITSHMKKGNNLLVVRVEGLLKPDRVPPGNVPSNPKDAFGNSFNPPASFDFFPYCGIQRPVLLFTIPSKAIQDLTVTTNLTGKKGEVQVEVISDQTKDLSLRLSLEGFGWKNRVESPVKGLKSVFRLVVPQARPWAPGSLNLYRLRVELKQAGKLVDQVRLPVGIRTIQVKSGRLLLNGKPIFLKGFGRHEDYPGFGRYLPPVALRKDYANMKWAGANSFRTTHYPYSDQDLDMADRLGFLVIDETPAVGLFFAKKGLSKRLALCRQFTREMIGRDKNHPSVVAWSLANEPHSKRKEAVPFFKSLASLTRSLDKTRPVTLVSYLGTQEESFRFLDLVCVNRYFGWYSEPGDLGKAIPRLSRDLDGIHRKFRKPLLVTEFGADALPGSHSDPPVMFSEEYQAKFISSYLRLFREKPYLAGSHVWNLCDFRTAQATHRPNAMNYKGVFTRNRQPKLAARVLRRWWNKS